MRAVDEIVAAVQRVLASHTRPIVVAVDGASGAGKSTLASIVQRRLGAARVLLDDFYTTRVPEDQWMRRAVAQRLGEVFESERVREEAIGPLRAGRAARWRAFDFEAGLGPDGTYVLKLDFTEVSPAPAILLEGSYSASPPLADQIDLSVLVDVPVHERHRRTVVRDEAVFLERWHTIWDKLEDYYFNDVRPPDSFDLVVANHCVHSIAHAG
jgi:uridine kinase